MVEALSKILVATEAPFGIFMDGSPKPRGTVATPTRDEDDQWALAILQQALADYAPGWLGKEAEHQAHWIAKVYAATGELADVQGASDLNTSF